MPPKKPVGNRGKPQGSDRDAHPRVAESSATPPPPDAPPPSELPPRRSKIIRIRIAPHLRRPKGSGVAAQPRRAETLAPPPSAVATSSGAPPPSAMPTSSSAPPPSEATRTLVPSTLSSLQPRQGRLRHASTQARDPPMSSTALRVEDKAQDPKSSSDLDAHPSVAESSAPPPLPDAPPPSELPSSKSKCKEGTGDASDTSKLEELEWTDADWMLAKGCVEMNYDQVITGLTLKRVALISHPDMLLHESPYLDPTEPETIHPERPERLIRIMSKLKKDKLFDRCDLFKPDEIARSYLLAVHNSAHVKEVETLEAKTQRQRNLLAQKHDSVYFNGGSTRAASLAAGGTVKACTLVAEGMYKYSFALVRPPGHHAGPSGPSGFCIFNNIGAAAAHLLKKYEKKKILIVDWDVHNGDGTHQTFYKDDRVLFISLHRQNFYPPNDLGDPNRTGEGKGRGFTVNLGWNHMGIRDVDFMYAFDHVVLPIAEEFKPDIILISAGFDAAEGDLLGGCKMTPAGYATLLDKLMKLGLPIVMVLEGGYGLDSLPNCVSACVKVLLGDRSHIHSEMKSLPYETTVLMVEKVRQKLSSTWKVLRKDIPEEISRSIPVPKELESVE